MKYKLFFFLVIIQTYLWPYGVDPITEIYPTLSNIYSPTIEDLRTLQHSLSHTYRPLVEYMQDTAFIAKDFKIIGTNSHELPETGYAAVNCSESEKENCIILYASFNRNYPNGVRRLFDLIAHSDFRGHVYYRIGGWPNMHAGDLTLVHVPFAFKVCFFREVQQLGYKKVLWLDASILPWENLNTIFQMIGERGFFVQANTHQVGIYMNHEAAAAFGLTVEETMEIPSCSAAILGVDLTNSNTAPIIDKWYHAAKDPIAFYSARSDQNALSIILYQMGLIHQMWPATTLGEPNGTHSETLFLMDRTFVKNPLVESRFRGWHPRKRQRKIRNGWPQPVQLKADHLNKPICSR